MDQRIRLNRSTITKLGGAAAGAALLAAAAFAPRAFAPPQGPAPAAGPAQLAPAAAQAPPGPAPKGLAASRAAYAQRLEALRRTRPERKRERLEDVELKYRRVAHLAGFEDELRVHVERIARLRRAGALAVAERRSYETRTKVLALTMKELTRHRAVVRAFERRAREET